MIEDTKIIELISSNIDIKTILILLLYLEYKKEKKEKEE